MSESNGPQLEMWAIDRLKPYEKNPRTLPDKAVAKIASSLKTFGFQKPIVVDEQGVIIAGHGRFEAARLIGLEVVPVIRLGHLNSEQRRALVREAMEMRRAALDMQHDLARLVGEDTE